MPKVLTEAQVTAYRRDGFVGPIDLLTTEEAADLRRKVEAVEATMGDQIQKRCKIKAHLPFPFLCEVIALPRLLDAVDGALARATKFNDVHALIVGLDDGGDGAAFTQRRDVAGDDDGSQALSPCSLSVSDGQYIAPRVATGTQQSPINAGR